MITSRIFWELKLWSKHFEKLEFPAVEKKFCNYDLCCRIRGVTQHINSMAESGSERNASCDAGTLSAIYEFSLER